METVMKMNNSITIIIILIILKQVNSHSFNIESLNSSSGIFYKNMGTVLVYNQYFTLVTYKNLSHYETKLNVIQNQLEETEEICEHDKKKKTKNVKN